MKYFISIPLWGEQYVQIFYQYSLPTHLAKGNIPYLKEKNFDLEILIFTTYESVPYIKTYEIQEILEKYGHVKIIFIDETLSHKNEKKYNMLSWCVNYTLKLAYDLQEEISCYFSQADAIYSTNFFKYVNDNKINILLENGLWVDGNKIKDQLESHRNGYSIDIPSQALARYAIRSLHASTASYAFKSKKFNKFASGIFYAKDDYMISKYFHIYPIFIKIMPHMERKFISNGYTPDNSPDFFEDDFFNNATVLKDSKDIFVFGVEFSIRQELVKYEYQANIFRFASLIGKLFFKNHLRAFKQEIIYGEPSQNDREFFEVQKEMEKFGYWVEYLYQNKIDISYLSLELFFAQIDLIENNDAKMRTLILKIRKWIELLSAFYSLEKYTKLLDLTQQLLNYLEKTIFDKNDIEIIFENFREVIYLMGCPQDMLKQSLYQKIEILLKPCYKRIVLYGYGEYGKMLHTIFEKLHLKNITVIDDNYHDTNIISFQEYKSLHQENTLFILCSTREPFFKKMQENIEDLQKINYQKDIVINDDFFRDIE